MSSPFSNSQVILQNLKIHHAQLLKKHEIIKLDQQKLLNMAKRYGTQHFKESYDAIIEENEILLEKIERVERQMKKIQMMYMFIQIRFNIICTSRLLNCQNLQKLFPLKEKDS